MFKQHSITHVFNKSVVKIKNLSELYVIIKHIMAKFKTRYLFSKGLLM